MKRSIPLLITALVGLTMMVQHFVPMLAWASDYASIFFDILAAVAFVLGGGNLLRAHSEKIVRGQAGWAYSMITVVCFLATLICGTFKVGVKAKPGFTCLLTGTAQVRGEAKLADADGALTLDVVVRGAEPGSKHAVTLAGRAIGEITIDRRGWGQLSLNYKPPAANASQPAAATAYLTEIKDKDVIAVGSLLRGELRKLPWISGDFIHPGSVFWFAFEYGFTPLVQTTFAMLAFYVASAAFRAFRARNLESVLLLGTAFIVLLGRTYFGGVVTGFLPNDGFLSFFGVPHLTQWIMQVMNTAGQRAIMIGIALGIASTSLKVLLAIDRSYLGSDGR
ncbi:MAG: hypothetical protein CHACPFDD_02658 [Phycisphaerae bacterium]|nr:hypothetical protein [Phycisphaerae bacterium]